MSVTVFSGKRLYAARLRAGRSQEDLAFALRQQTHAKTGARTVRRWETGESTPHSRLIPAIASVLGVAVDELYGNGTDDEDGDRALLAEIDRLPASAIPEELRRRIRDAIVERGVLVEPGALT